MKDITLKKGTCGTYREGVENPALFSRLYFDRKKRRIWARLYHSENSWTMYDDDAIIEFIPRDASEYYWCDRVPNLRQRIIDGALDREYYLAYNDSIYGFVDAYDGEE